ncbi:MAG: hypothetical protein AAF383_27190 [Cyanobacteria bacterium P01_A01_bin.83]
MDLSSASDIINLLSGMGVAGVVGNLATDSVKRLWKKICDRLQYDSDARDLIDRVEQNKSDRYLKMLIPCLEEAMEDREFAAEIEEIAKEVIRDKSTNIEFKEFIAKDRSVVVGSNTGGININTKK